MGPIKRFSHFVDAHSEFNRMLQNNSKLISGTKPFDLDGENVEYVVYEDILNTVHCFHQIGDRHYSGIEAIKFLSRK